MGSAVIDFALATLSVALGSLVQAITGTGAGFVVVPLLALIDLAYVPGPLVFASIALSLLMAVRGRAHIDRRRVPVVLLGIAPGAVCGAFLVTRTASESAGLFFGGVILLAVALSAFGLPIPERRDAAFGAGAVSGVLGAAAGIGGPVLALLFQNEALERLRATLAVLYTGAALVILGVLHSFGRFGVRELLIGLELVPGFLLGFAISERLTGRFHPRHARPAVLGLSAAAALVLIFRSL